MNCRLPVSIAIDPLPTGIIAAILLPGQQTKIAVHDPVYGALPPGRASAFVFCYQGVFLPRLLFVCAAVHDP